MKDSAGQMLMFIGKMMMMEDGDLNGFEQRMEQFGRDMELKGKTLSNKPTKCVNN